MTISYFKFTKVVLLKEDIDLRRSKLSVLTAYPNISLLVFDGLVTPANKKSPWIAIEIVKNSL